MIRAHWPGETASAPEKPAGMSPTTGSSTGDDSDAPARSADRTA